MTSLFSLTRSRICQVQSKTTWQLMKLAGVTIPYFRGLNVELDDRFTVYSVHRDTFVPPKALALSNTIIPAFEEVSGTVVWGGESQGKTEYNVALQHSTGEIGQIGTFEFSAIHLMILPNWQNVQKKR